MADGESSAVDLVRRAFETLNERDRTTFLDLHADDVVLHVGDKVIRGAETVADEEWSHFDAFPDLTVEPDEIVAADGTVAVRWTATGTHEGEFRGIAPTGVRVEYHLMGMFRVEDAQVTEVWLVADRFALLQQIGASEVSTA